ncbi:3-oxoacyl-[acyl-carrier-protein] reductase [Acetitomaculum ruminis DSM 5522]|uniref:3-oxoacyl-[acyl-carrier-protein] reductase n=1 Tax=Acetitomaculum ruminis DSM 5522 TaxID=1120918 RepID=A0A1I0ZP25_9FIRM|nr:3-oxoacyl-[acyl-carrier-protein] reductase [Acetitomaculum ruminis]SFB26866.1 3-oxoacyl-[acyl-carrier-protein] reductase [Acetitomaculum ruminis DSM 5522]
MLDDKVAVITGGTRGIGKAIALEMAKKGANLALIATKESQDTKDFVKELSDISKKVTFHACDVSKRDMVEKVSKDIINEHKRIDILVNNAGITKDNLLIAMTDDEINDVIDINLKGCMYVSSAFLKVFMKQKQGNIINISSVVGLMGNAGQSNYAASKAGVTGLTKAIAKEYGKRNIRCNAIAPGYIKTEMTEVLSDDIKKKIENSIILKRLGEPEDVAKLAVFLASDDSGYISGEVIKVDGGMYV